MDGNIMVAQGWKCSKCGLISAYDRPTCNPLTDYGYEALPIKTAITLK